MEEHLLNERLKLNRRHFFSKLSAGIGTLALGSLMIPEVFRGRNLSAEKRSVFPWNPSFRPESKTDYIPLPGWSSLTVRILRL